MSKRYLLLRLLSSPGSDGRVAAAALRCALLSVKYSAHLVALREEFGEAAVVRVGGDDADEPFPPRVLGPADLPGPPPGRYVIECVLGDGISLHASDHREFGLRKLARPAAPPQPWIVEVVMPSLAAGYNTGHLSPGRPNSDGDVDSLLAAVADALGASRIRPAG